jgi:hypothetical protein
MTRPSVRRWRAEAFGVRREEADLRDVLRLGEVLAMENSLRISGCVPICASPDEARNLCGNAGNARKFRARR